MKKDIYIIKNSVNAKVYVGQAKNAAERWLSHIYNARYEAKINKDVQVLHKAMIKYGIDKFHYEILEYQIENYDEREIYWIDYYSSRVPNGYNVAIGGNSSGCGFAHPSALFDEEALTRCISEISSTEKTFSNIAKKFHCSPEVISAINSGKRYRDDRFSYPIRNTDTRYSYEVLRQIRYSLKYELDLTIKDIARKYSVDCSQVSEINNGRIYFVANEKYPLREKRRTDLSKDTVRSIVNDILYSDMCMSDIANKYNISTTRVSGINSGTYYRDNSMSYPLRAENDKRNKSKKKFIDISIIIDIHRMLKGNESIRAIADKYGISVATVNNINNGSCKKYVLSGNTYPIRNTRR